MPGWGEGSARRDTPPGADPYGGMSSTGARELARAPVAAGDAVAGVEDVPAPISTPEPKPAPFVDRPTLDLVAMELERERIARLAGGGGPWDEFYGPFGREGVDWFGPWR